MSAEHNEAVTAESLLEMVEQLRLANELLRTENEHLIETQRSLEVSGERYSDLFDNAPVAWLTLDERGAISRLNLAAVTLLGFGRSHLIGAPLTTLLRSEDRRRFLDYLSSCEEDQLSSCEVSFAMREGHALPVRLFTHRTHTQTGGHTITLVDLRERDAAVAEQRRLIKAEQDARSANAAKDQFIAMLSHELRTPLTPVLAAASALAELDELPAEVRETLSIVQRNVSLEAQLIDDLLDLARITHGKLRVEKQPVDAHRAVLDALQTLGGELEAKRHELTLDLNAHHNWVDGDATRLQQVFWNLVRNAIKFTREGGHIAVRSWNSGERLLVEVSDDGQGIDAETLPRLFEPFEQASDNVVASVRGLGLGLPITRGILDQHDASIVANSQGHGKGARFVVEIGMIDRPTLQPPAPVSQSSPPSGRVVRILLVEDHEDTADIFERLLRRRGYEVQVANSLQSALTVQREEFDVLLSDVGLSDGSGLDLMRTLRKTGKVKGIALSGYGTEEDIRASKEAGFAAHITKPVEFDALLEAIATLHR